MADPSLLHPRCWPAWLGLGLLRLAAFLPYRVLMRLGDAIGTLAWYLVPYRRRIVETNLSLCFPDLDRRERQRLARSNLRYTGRGLMEVALAWWGGAARLEGLAEREGVAHLHAALAEGRGVLLVGAHFTPLDLTGRLLQQAVPIHAIYRAHPNPVVERAMAAGRRRHIAGALERGDMRGMVRVLRRGGVLWYPPDQDYGRRHSVFAPFFGVQAATITMTARLARLSGAVVMPAYGVARPDGRGYCLRIHPPLEGFPGGDDEADARRLNAQLEAEVRRYPAQYYWVHRRFKTRPEGEPNPYAGPRWRRSGRRRR